MEVKDVSLSSQRANLAKIQSQILKMAHDARLTGEIQIWGNRQNILPEIRTFAEQHGIPVAERLRTGTSNLRPEDLRFERFANELDQRFRFQARLNAIAGSVRLGMGAFMAYQASRQLENDFSDFGGSQRDWLRLGEHASILLGGGSFAVAGTAQLLTHQIPRLADNGRLISVTRWGGRAGVAGTVLTEGFLISQYISGDLTERQFLLGQASFGAGLAGGAAGGYVGLKAGALAGGAIGSIFGPAGTAIGAGIGGTIGAIGGGIGGGYAGAHFAERSVESLYQFQDSEQAERYAQFLLRHYQSR